MGLGFLDAISDGGLRGTGGAGVSRCHLLRWLKKTTAGFCARCHLLRGMYGDPWGWRS